MKLTIEEEERIIWKMRQDWQAVGGDVLLNIADYPNASVSGTTVRDIALDRFREYMYHDKELAWKWDQLSYNQRMKVAKKAFPLRRYVW